MVTLLHTVRHVIATTEVFIRFRITAEILSTIFIKFQINFNNDKLSLKMCRVCTIASNLFRTV